MNESYKVLIMTRMVGGDSVAAHTQIATFESKKLADTAVSCIVAADQEFYDNQGWFRVQAVKLYK